MILFYEPINVPIKSLKAIECLDSRGQPTVACQCVLNDGSYGFSSVPSGASTGQYEAHELRDQDLSRYGGKGVLKAIDNINHIIAPQIYQNRPDTIKAVDDLLCSLDTQQKNKIGANATLAVSIAYTRARAMHLGCQLYESLQDHDQPLVMPVPYMNMINGGKHARNELVIQEFMIVPHGFDRFSESVQCGAEVMAHLASILDKYYPSIGRGDEGGYAPTGLSDPVTAIEHLKTAIKHANYTEKEVSIALDCAATEYHKDHMYAIDKDFKTVYDKQAWIEYLVTLSKQFQLCSIEDPLAEEDFSGWATLTSMIGNQTQLVGDDIFVSQSHRLKQGIEKNCGNAILIKPNQIGTVTEIHQTVQLARHHGYQIMVSHRSGETEDTFISDLACAWRLGQIKCGPPKQTDRTAKLNRLKWIECLSSANKLWRFSSQRASAPVI
ncbi:MAG: phosphopyruvate hydratase [Pseudomonadota bacterium]|nr:phosphopyruvate hydratase [Pseudomonadota bacterium]